MKIVFYACFSPFATPLLPSSFPYVELIYSASNLQACHIVFSLILFLSYQNNCFPRRASRWNRTDSFEPHSLSRFSSVTFFAATLLKLMYGATISYSTLHFQEIFSFSLFHSSFCYLLGLVFLWFVSELFAIDLGNFLFKVIGCDLWMEFFRLLYNNIIIFHIYTG